MRVLIATDTYLPMVGGIPLTIKNLIDHLEKSELDYLLVAPGPGIPQEKNVIRLSYFKDPFIKGKTGSYFFSAFCKVGEIIKRGNFDIVHIEEMGSVGIAALIWGKLCHKKIVGTLHTDPRQVPVINSYLKIIPFLEQIIKKYLEFFYNKCDLITVPTGSFKKRMNFVKEVVPISNGVDTQKFQPISVKEAPFLKQKGLPENKTIFLYLGRLDPDKNVETIVEAFLKSDLKNSILILSGNGSLIPILEKISMSHKNIFVLPNPAFSEIPQIYKNSDIFVIASKIETQSMVTLEAMASGLAIVAAKAGALPELCEDGVNGYLFDPNRADDLTNKMRLILQDEVKLQTMKRECRRIIEREHELEKCMEKYVHIYQQLVNKT